MELHQLDIADKENRMDDEEKRFVERYRNMPMDVHDRFSKQKLELTTTMAHEGIPLANLDLTSKNKLLDAVLSSDPQDLIKAKDEILIRERVRNTENNESRRIQKAASVFEKAGRPVGGAVDD